MECSGMKKRTEWWEKARFGMFIHWGLYAIPARGEWVMHIEEIPKEEYALLANVFNPKKFNAESWVKLAKESGMKYMVLTTRHHDGFSLFDSKVSDFTSVKTASGKDFVGEYVKACRKHNMKIGFYYSLLDWRYKAYFDGPKKDPKAWEDFLNYVYTQVRELCTNYGKIDILWFDGQWPPSPEAWDNIPIEEAWQSKRLISMIRELQPHILINDRTGLPGDFETPEQYILQEAPERPWETCMTMNDTWGYARGDKNWKSTRQLIMNLVLCVSKGGNFILNIGPKADGTVPLPSVKRLEEIGKWLRFNGESIYGACISPLFSNKPPYIPFSGGMVGFTTFKNKEVYLHVFRWPGEEICIGRVTVKVKRGYFLATGEEVKVFQRGTRLFIQGLPKKAPDPIDSVIVLEIEE